jgi:hypothetical protein
MFVRPRLLRKELGKNERRFLTVPCDLNPERPSDRPNDLRVDPDKKVGLFDERIVLFFLGGELYLSLKNSFFTGVLPERVSFTFDSPFSILLYK